MGTGPGTGHSVCVGQYMSTVFELRAVLKAVKKQNMIQVCEYVLPAKLCCGSELEVFLD